MLAIAQNRSTAEMVGTVTDPSGAVAPGVKITVQNVATKVVVQTQTSAAGYYDVPALPPGSYDVTFENPGFQTVKRNGIHLVLDQTARIDVTMPIGAAQSIVEVQATTPLIETDKSERQTNFTSELTQNLPLVARDPLEMAGLAPGTSTAQQSFSSKDPGRVNVNGNRAFTIQATVNGRIRGAAQQQQLFRFRAADRRSQRVHGHQR